MVELLENREHIVVPPRLRAIKSPSLKPVTKLHVDREFGNLHEKKKVTGDEEDEIPFENWVMPAPEKRYIKPKTYDFL